MTENFSTFSCQDNQFKESVCINAYRIYDSCADKDCLENLRDVWFLGGERGKCGSETERDLCKPSRLSLVEGSPCTHCSFPLLLRSLLSCFR